MQNAFNCFVLETLRFALEMFQVNVLCTSLQSSIYSEVFFDIASQNHYGWLAAVLEAYKPLDELRMKLASQEAAASSLKIGAFGAVTLYLGEWLQQTPGMTSELSIQKALVLGTVTILCRALNLLGLWYRI